MFHTILSVGSGYKGYSCTQVCKSDQPIAYDQVKNAFENFDDMTAKGDAAIWALKKGVFEGLGEGFRNIKFSKMSDCIKILLEGTEDYDGCDHIHGGRCNYVVSVKDYHVYRIYTPFQCYSLETFLVDFPLLCIIFR